jgi:hypothetical protein
MKYAVMLLGGAVVLFAVYELSYWVGRVDSSLESVRHEDAVCKLVRRDDLLRAAARRGESFEVSRVRVRVNGRYRWMKLGDEPWKQDVQYQSTSRPKGN